jgi:hypothetical protein
MSTAVLANLSPKDRVLVIMAVLIDGHEAEAFLNLDPSQAYLGRAANELLKLPVEIRAPLLGSILRREINLLDKSPKGFR